MKTQAKIQAYFDIEMLETKRKEQGLSMQALSLLITNNKVTNTYFYLLKRRFMTISKYVKALCDWFGSNSCIIYIIVTNNQSAFVLSPLKCKIKGKQTHEIQFHGYTYYYYS